jgi:hypothetical protein
MCDVGRVMCDVWPTLQDTISNSTTITPMIRRNRPEAAAAAKAYPVLLRVKTSAVRGAGTSAAVYVSLYGTTGTALKQVCV